MSEIRLDVFGWQQGYRAVASLNRTVNDSGIDPTLLELIKVRRLSFVTIGRASTPVPKGPQG